MIVTFIVILTGQGQRNKVHAFPTHDGATQTAVVPPVPDVELVPTVGTEGHVRVAHPWHHRLLYGCGGAIALEMEDEMDLIYLNMMEVNKPLILATSELVLSKDVS